MAKNNYYGKIIVAKNYRGKNFPGKKFCGKKFAPYNLIIEWYCFQKKNTIFYLVKVNSIVLKKSKFLVYLQTELKGNCIVFEKKLSKKLYCIVLYCFQKKN